MMSAIMTLGFWVMPYWYHRSQVFIGLNGVRMGCLIKSRGSVRRHPFLFLRGYRMFLGNFPHFIPYRVNFFRTLCSKLCFTPSVHVVFTRSCKVRDTEPSPRERASSHG